MQRPRRRASATGAGALAVGHDAAAHPRSAPRRRDRDPRAARPPPRRHRARISGSSAASCRASRRAASTGAAPRATIISMCASRNGKPRIRCGSGRTARPRWCSPRRWCWETKLDRALVIAFALAEVLVEGGERVGIPGLMRPSASRNIIEKMAETIVHDPTERASLPPSFAPSPQSEVVVLSDLWSPIADVQRTIAQLSANGAHGHVVQIVDPAEETFPFSGRVEFFDPEDGHSITVGRAEAWREEYQKRARAPSRRNPRRDRPARLELHHPPHRPARRPSCCSSCTPAWAPGRAAPASTAPPASSRERAHDRRPPARFRAAAGAARSAQPAGAVVAAAARAAAPAPPEARPGKAAARHPAEGRDAGAHAVVAHAVAPHARGAADHRRRRPVVESAARDLAGVARRSRC